MGLASSMGLGLAMARLRQKVIILDGDGALLMNLNSLTTAAARMPQNLIHVIWDNRQFELTGGQPTHTALCKAWG
jgi:thiamine pyrophosphate-dependent acetolactate synthase large subunit-like protein